MSELFPIRDAARASFLAACRRCTQGESWPVTSAALTGALLAHHDTIQRARDVLATVARQLDAIEAESKAASSTAVDRRGQRLVAGGVR